MRSIILVSLSLSNHPVISAQRILTQGKDKLQTVHKQQCSQTNKTLGFCVGKIHAQDIEKMHSESVFKNR